MKIGLEAERANLPNPTGVERYAAELIRNLAAIDHINQYILYFRTKPQEWFYTLPANFKIKVMPFPKFWTQLRLSLEMILHPVDILMVPASALPFIHPKKSVVTVHDIAFELFSGIYTGFMDYYQKFFARFAARHAVKIITVSQSTKTDLMEKYKVPPEKINVIYLAADPKFKCMSYGDVQPVLDKHNLTYKKYILFVGTLQPRKNIIGLIDAFSKLKKENRIEETLVIAGGKGWLFEPILKKIKESEIAGSVRFLGYLNDKDQVAIYNGATLLTLPAFYEGFGLPPLEAMSCGVPVVVSNLSSLPEVVGEAGKLVDPTSIDSMAEGILEVLEDRELQKNMMEKGLAQAAKFSWRTTAKKTLEVFKTLK